MPHREIWLAELCNNYLPGLGNIPLKLLGLPAEPRPWRGFMVMQLLVALIIIVLFAFLRRRLSVDQPGKLQHIFELVEEFVRGQAEESCSLPRPSMVKSRSIRRSSAWMKRH